MHRIHSPTCIKADTLRTSLTQGSAHSLFATLYFDFQALVLPAQNEKSCLQINRTLKSVNGLVDHPRVFRFVL